MSTTKATINTDYGEITIWESYGDTHVKLGEIEMTLDVSSLEDLAIGQGNDFSSASMERYMSFSNWGMAELAQLSDLSLWVADLLGLIDEASAEEIAAADDRRRMAQEEREAEQARVDAMWAKRIERLMTEFLGEQGRIRVYGRKRWRTVKIESEDRYGEYVPALIYTSDRNGYGEIGNRAVKRVRAFEIKVGKRYQQVWDDGQDDLPIWHRSDASGSPQYDGALEDGE